MLAEQVLEHGGVRALGMRALRDLGELQRIAEQDHVARGRAHRQRVGERHLPGLVDHERVDERAAVEVPVREEPRGPGQELGAGGRRHELVACRRRCVIEALAYSVSPLPRAGFLEAAEADALARAPPRSISSSRL